jgi:hypothetical protein
VVVDNSKNDGLGSFFWEETASVLKSTAPASEVHRGALGTDAEIDPRAIWEFCNTIRAKADLTSRDH